MDVDRSVLVPVVERALAAAPVEPAAWSARPIVAGDGQGLGVYRLAGSARVARQETPWSVILKVLPAAAGRPASAWNYPAREALAYETGLLEALPDGLRAPRWLGHTRYADRHYLWLEDLGDDDGPWTLGDYGHAARQLGHFNGAFLAGHPVPGERWLSQDFLRAWLQEGSAAVEALPRHRRHPLVRRVYPSEILDELVRIWERRGTLLAALDRLPQVLCHHDAFRRNLFLRAGTLIAVDWAFLGAGPVGAELARKHGEARRARPRAVPGGADGKEA